MKSVMKALAWMALGGAMGVGATFALREATRTPIPQLGAMAPPSLEPPPPPPEPEKPVPAPVPPPPVIDTLPAQPATAGTAEPPPTPSAPPPRPPAFDYFGFAVAGPERAAPPPVVAKAPEPPPPPPPPPPALPKVLRFEPMKDRCAAGFDATSTLHDFRGWTKAVTGWVRFEADRLDETAAASFVVDARTLDTNNPDRDKEMHADFLHSAKFPEFRFELKEFRRTSPPGTFTMKGTMEIHGVAKEVEIPGTLLLRKDGYLHVKGEFRKKMSDFGISPPVTALIIRVDDEIKIWFELWARRQEDKP